MNKTATSICLVMSCLVLCACHSPITQSGVNRLPLTTAPATSTTTASEATTTIEPMSTNSPQTTPNTLSLKISISDGALIDLDGNGLAEYLRADVEVTQQAAQPLDVGIDAVLLNASGDLMAIGTLDISFERSAPKTGATLKADTEAQVISIYFSGQNLRSLQVDGPYKIVVRMRNESGDIRAMTTIETPPYTHTQFQGALVQVQAIRDEATKRNAAGHYTMLQVHIVLNMQATGQIELTGQLFEGETLIGNDSHALALSSGTHTITLKFAGSQIKAHRKDGPFTLYLVIYEQGQSLELKHLTAPYIAQNFE